MKRLLFASLVLLLTCNAWSAELTNVTCYATTPNGADPFVVAQHDVFELTLVQPVAYSIQDAFNRVAIQVVFSAPSGEQWTINGFYYQILPGNQSLWKARMAAVETGTWSFRWQFGFTDSSDIATGAGAFEVVPGSQHGFLGINPVNHFRWQYADGTPVNLHGFNDCFDATSLLSTDGGERTGAWGAGCTMDEYFRIYSEAGFNLFRFSQDNCSAILTDTALRLTSLNLDFAATFDVRK